MRDCIAREILQWEDETPLPESLLRCFIFSSPLSLRDYCLMWLCICSSTSFSQDLGLGDLHKPLRGYVAPEQSQVSYFTILYSDDGFPRLFYSWSCWTDLHNVRTGSEPIVQALQIILGPSFAMNLAGCTAVSVIGIDLQAPKRLNRYLLSVYAFSLSLIGLPRCPSHSKLQFKIAPISIEPFIILKIGLGCDCVFI